MALDFNKAFDNVTNNAIMNALSDLNVGERIYSYIKAFLADRTAKIPFASINSDTLQLGNKCTPQVSVLSPFQINITLMPMATLLAAIPNLSSALYTDDITLWTFRGNECDIESALQTGANIVPGCASRVVVTCS
ncbi:uncharacterized protein [Dermacentor andersoni]|uniref:uncharacterized protein n=1 Tax=Dermacentor andersoni TaxID=34620 RepID=UPI003B3B9749